jgi:hypothetical protein
VTGKLSSLRWILRGQKPSVVLGLVTLGLAAILLVLGVIGVIGLQHGKDSGFLAAVGLGAGLFTGVYAVAHLSFALVDRKHLRD